jgi:hypothetical protein
MLGFRLTPKEKQCSEEIVLKRKTIVATLMLALLLSTLMGSLFVKQVTANPEGSFPNLSMPVEYVNYTITSINGTLWAKIDGDYPIYLLKQMDCSFTGDLPMVYPMPPQTTNISISLDNKEVSWSNYTQIYPDALHHTAIGDWWMIYCNLENVSDYFELKIHYEHPIMQTDGTYQFLYDLNISPYLSSSYPNSTAYFTLTFYEIVSSLQVFTSPTDNTLNPLNYTSEEQNKTPQVTFTVASEYSKPLPGDIIVRFNYDFHEESFNWIPYTIIPLFLACIAVVAFIKKRKKQLRD